MAILFSKFLANLFKKSDSSETVFKQYLQDERGSPAHMRYNFRSKGYEDVIHAFDVSKDQEKEMTDFFKARFSKFIDEDDITSLDTAAQEVAKWVNKVFFYRTDFLKFRIEEFWRSPYEMFLEYQTIGKIEDDCDGYAVMICYILKCLGVPAHRRFVRAGDVFNKSGNPAGGHATCIYLPYQDPSNFYPLEGSFYPEYVNELFLEESLRVNKLYGKTWFICNEEVSYKGDIYG